MTIHHRAACPDREAREGLDWQEAYARLERIRRLLEADGGLSPDQIGRVLRERAQAVARRREEVSPPVEGIEILVFTLAGEQFGIATARVLEVVPARGLTPVPSVPAFVLGVVNHRGRILPVLDLCGLLALPRQAVMDGNRLVVVESGDMTFGLLAEAVSGVVQGDARAVAPPPGTLAVDRQALLRGVTGEMVAILDLEALTRDPRFIVNAEIR